MTPKELDERIRLMVVGWYDGEYVEPDKDDIKQLLYDVIQAITPERYVSPFGDGSIVEEVHNKAIDAMEENTKNLLGGKR